MTAVKVLNLSFSLPIGSSSDHICDYIPKHMLLCLVPFQNVCAYFYPVFIWLVPIPEYM